MTEMAARQPSKISKFPGRPVAKVLAIGGGGGDGAGEDAQFASHNRRVAAAATAAETTKEKGKGKKTPAGLISPPPRAESIFAMDDPDRLLYGIVGETEGESEEEDEPVTCFYVEKRSILRRGVGAAGGGAGVGGRARGNPNLAPTTGRPVAAGGLDDAQPVDRCFAHGASVVVEDEHGGGGGSGGGGGTPPRTPGGAGGAMKTPGTHGTRRRRAAPPPGMDNVFARLQHGTPHGPKQPNADADHDGRQTFEDEHARGDDVGYARFGATEPVCVCRDKKERVPRLVDLAVSALVGLYELNPVDP
jgi:hypothetical protein